MVYLGLLYPRLAMKATTASNSSNNSNNNNNRQHSYTFITLSRNQNVQCVPETFAEDTGRSCAGISRRKPKRLRKISVGLAPISSAEYRNFCGRYRQVLRRAGIFRRIPKLQREKMHILVSQDTFIFFYKRKHLLKCGMSHDWDSNNSLHIIIFFLSTFIIFHNYLCNEITIQTRLVVYRKFLRMRPRDLSEGTERSFRGYQTQAFQGGYSYPRGNNPFLKIQWGSYFS